MILTLAQVALGGAIGASLRFLSGVAAIRLVGHGFPWATLFVNVAGSFAMGVLVVVLAQQGNRLAPFLMTGVLGGFTTFSAFAVEVVEQVDAGAALLAAAYVLASVVGGIGAVALGARAGQALTERTAR
jgi:CrcB protein